jgi:hypothetical protein
MKLYYGSSVPPLASTLDSLDLFDDRTLSSLAGRPADALIGVLGDGVDNDNPYRALPLERWRDRVTAR